MSNKMRNSRGKIVIPTPEMKNESFHSGAKRINFAYWLPAPGDARRALKSFLMKTG
jgi:hypothetical protein